MLLYTYNDTCVLHTYIYVRRVYLSAAGKLTLVVPNVDGFPTNPRIFLCAYLDLPKRIFLFFSNDGN